MFGNETAGVSESLKRADEYSWRVVSLLNSRVLISPLHIDAECEKFMKRARAEVLCKIEVSRGIQAVRLEYSELLATYALYEEEVLHGSAPQEYIDYLPVFKIRLGLLQLVTHNWIRDALRDACKRREVLRNYLCKGKCKKRWYWYFGSGWDVHIALGRTKHLPEESSYFVSKVTERGVW